MGARSTGFNSLDPDPGIVIKLVYMAGDDVSLEIEQPETELAPQTNLPPNSEAVVSLKPEVKTPRDVVFGQVDVEEDLEKDLWRWNG